MNWAWVPAAHDHQRDLSGNPKVRNPKNRIRKQEEYEDPVYSYYILGVSYFGVPILVPSIMHVSYTPTVRSRPQQLPIEFEAHWKNVT